MAGQKWIRIEAEAVIDDSRAARVAMLEANPSLGSMYSADDGVMAVFYLKNATAAICSRRYVLTGTTLEEVQP